MIKPTVRELVVVQTRVADTALADDCVFSGTSKSAVKCRCDDRVLLIRHRRRGVFANVIVGSEVWTNRNVVPRHEPEARDVDLHIVVPQPALVPRSIVRLALDHRAARGDRHAIGKDAVWTTGGFHDVLDGQVSKSFRPVDLWQLRSQVKRARRANQFLLRRAWREHWAHLVLLTVKPRDEQHLHRAAAIPVSLFVPTVHSPDTGAITLRNHRRKRRMPLRRDSHLPFSR